jgi:hypothetical protein
VSGAATSIVGAAISSPCESPTNTDTGPEACSNDVVDDRRGPGQAHVAIL